MYKYKHEHFLPVLSLSSFLDCRLSRAIKQKPIRLTTYMRFIGTR